MSEKYIIPTPKSVTSLLAMVIGDDLVASSCEMAGISGGRLATFINDNDDLAAVCVCDHQFVVYSGAALSMIPAAAAADMVTSNDVSDAIADNFYEVMNISSKLLMSDNSAHLRLDRAMDAGSGADKLSGMESCTTKIGFEIDIPGYGKGKMAFLIN